MKIPHTHDQPPIPDHLSPFNKQSSCSGRAHTTPRANETPPLTSACPINTKTVKDHPYSKFCWGNMWSLRHEPLSKGVDVRQELVEFHAKHYRAPLMQLVVLGGQSLDELQDLVVSSFSGVAPGEASAESGGEDGGGAGGLPQPSAAVAAAGLPFDAAGTLGRAFRVQPVRDLHRLHVTWQLGEQHRCVAVQSGVVCVVCFEIPRARERVCICVVAVRCATPSAAALHFCPYGEIVP